MGKSYILSVARDSMRLYVGRLETDGRYSVFEDTECRSLQQFEALPLTDADRQGASVGVMFSPAFSEAARTTVVDGLHNRGFGNVAEYACADYLCRTVKGHRTLLVVSADGDDLFVEHYGVEGCRHVATAMLPGGGRDPMASVLAESIWSKIVIGADYLDKADSMKVLLRVAKDFLHTGRPELEGEVCLHGRTFEFFVTRADARVDNSIDQGGSSLLSWLNDFANRQSVRLDDTVLALSDGIAGNPYFGKLLNGLAASMVDVGPELYKSLLDKIVNDVNGNNVFEGDGGVVADSLPPGCIHVSPGDTSISFSIDVPENISRINVYRDGVLVRTVLDAGFSDTGLVPDHEYHYAFEMVFTNSLGYEVCSPRTDMTIRTLSVKIHDVVLADLSDGDWQATLSWRRPLRGEVRVFVSDKPFGLHTNDRICLSGFGYDTIDSLGDSYIVEKDFCGMRYFLTVTCVGDTGIVGNEQCVESMIVPRGVRVDSTDVSHVKVVWVWQGVPAVRIAWMAEGKNERWADVPADGRLPEFELPLEPGTLSFSVSVRSLCPVAGGKVLLGDPVMHDVALTPVTVEFLKARSESLLFMHKDEYSLTLRASGEPPCDLYLLIGEGTVPLNLNNFKSYLTVPRSEIADGNVHKFTLAYHRTKPREPLFFRLAPADKNLPLRVLPETQRVK